jgi:cephalosporin hydroxylase
VREFAQLVSLLRERRLKTVVEIGSDRGGTLYAWCRLAEPDALIVSIDLPGGAFGRGQVELATLAQKYAQPGQSLNCLAGDSHDPAIYRQLLELLGKTPIDFLMIDGDHTYEGVKRDFELYSPMVSPGGVIAFHDTLPHEPSSGCEVDRFWKEVSRHYQTREFVDPFDDRGRGQWGGIGVVFWEGTVSDGERPRV